jgi:CubicO group peptidase (beta-lactamase class C family)
MWIWYHNSIAWLGTTFVGLILVWLLSGSPCLAQELPTPPSGPTDPQELEAFLDPFFAKNMTEQHIPGAVFVLVKDGKIFFSKGYGYADLENKIPVVPDKTLFRVGSLSKLLTTTAVMQLAEQGKLKLDDDVNKYLKRFQIKKTYPQPVTFAHLLTHTHGFDSGWGIKAFVRSKSEMTPLGDYLAKRLPPRILPPGEVFLYSDVGMTLAGYLVEVISGVPFAQYIQQNILQPLDMRRSSFFQPLPPQLAPDLAVGYRYTNGTYQRRPFAFNNNVPGSAFMATATDMAHFAIAQLQNGRYGEARILNEATAKEMHRQQFAHHPGMVGSAYGFSESWENNQKAIEHGGRLNGYTTRLYLLPDQNLGLFVSCNNNPSSLPRELVTEFLKHYYPVKEKSPSPVQPLTGSQKPDQHLYGTYRYNSYSHLTLEKLGAVLGDAPEVKVMAGADNDGTLALYVPQFKWVELKPLLFRSIYSDTELLFRQNERGSITHMFIGDSVFAALEKLAWYETKAFQLTLAIFCALSFVSACLVRLVSWLIRRSRKQLSQSTRMTRLAQFLAVLVSACNLVFLIGMGLVFFRTDYWQLFFGLPRVAMVLLCIPPITAGLTLGLLLFTVLAWKNKYYSLIGRLHYSLITVAAVAFILFLNYWNLLGFRIP